MTIEPYNQLTCQAVSPHEPRTPSTPPHLRRPPNVAGNSPWSVFNTTHKRYNSNDPVYLFERFTWELHAALLGNHNARRQRTPNRKDLKPTGNSRPKGARAPCSHTTRSNTPAGALHPLRNHAPDQGHCTRSEEVHCLRIGCSTPTHKNKRGTGKPSRSWPTSSPSIGRRAGAGRLSCAPLTLPYREPTHNATSQATAPKPSSASPQTPVFAGFHPSGLHFEHTINDRQPHHHTDSTGGDTARRVRVSIWSDTTSEARLPVLAGDQAQRRTQECATNAQQPALVTDRQRPNTRSQRPASRGHQRPRPTLCPRPTRCPRPNA